jgi:hypothetical protein
MAYMDELSLGDRVTVTDLRRGTKHDGTIVALCPDETGGANSRVEVAYDSGVVVRVGPGFVALHMGEEEPAAQRER